MTEQEKPKNAEALTFDSQCGLIKVIVEPNCGMGVLHDFLRNFSTYVVEKIVELEKNLSEKNKINNEEAVDEQTESNEKEVCDQTP